MTFEDKQERELWLTVAQEQIRHPGCTLERALKTADGFIEGARDRRKPEERPASQEQLLVEAYIRYKEGKEDVPGRPIPQAHGMLNNPCPYPK